jgi:hypothetical protein
MDYDAAMTELSHVQHVSTSAVIFQAALIFLHSRKQTSEIETA